MIDLHSHILHGIDDGASDIEVALEMARRAADDGVEVMACTPHFLPGIYDPSVADVIARVADLNDRLMAEGIDLVVVSGCEAHVRPDMVERLRNAQILTLHTGRHVLCEAPPNVLPPHMDRLFMNMSCRRLYADPGACRKISLDRPRPAVGRAHVAVGRPDAGDRRILLRRLRTHGGGVVDAASPRWPGEPCSIRRA